MKLETVLQEIGDFVFYSQDGNMGDLLIGEGTRQLFNRLGLRYLTYNEDLLPDKYTLVHSGGARFTSNWCRVEQAIEDLCNEHVEKCIILPHSFYNVDELLKHFDERHIIFCRDKYSYAYCKEKCKKSQVYLSHDMAFYLRLVDTRPVPVEGVEGNCITWDEKGTYRDIKNGLFRRIHHGVKQAIVNARIGGEEKRVAFLLRTDSEKKVGMFCPLAYDVSIAWHTTGSNMMFNGNILRQFSNALQQADVIVSDRLHVCIMAYLSGCEVYMLDNSYRKLSGVYEQSMQHSDRVHLLPNAEYTPELECAWKKLLDTHRAYEMQQAKLAKSKRLKLRKLLGKCKQFMFRVAKKCVHAVSRLVFGY